MPIDHSPALNYEHHEWWRYFLMPLLIYPLAFWVAGKKLFNGGKKLKTNTFWVDGLSPVCRQIRENAINWRALNIIYNYQPKNNNFTDSITKFWMNGVVNIKAVRNRLKLIKNKLREEIKNLLSKNKEVKILSIASGSSQGLIEIMSEFKQKNILIKASLLDLDLTAIEHSKKLAQDVNVLEQINFINKNSHDLEEIIGDFKPNIIEMVGFLEYRPEENAIKLIKRIYNILEPGGVFLTSNIRSNAERLFLHYVVDWPMIYRSPEEFTEILTKGGLLTENCEIIYEPLKIHGVAICKKPE